MRPSTHNTCSVGCVCTHVREPTDDEGHVTVSMILKSGCRPWVMPSRSHGQVDAAHRRNGHGIKDGFGYRLSYIFQHQGELAAVGGAGEGARWWEVGLVTQKLHAFFLPHHDPASSSS